MAGTPPFTQLKRLLEGISPRTYGSLRLHYHRRLLYKMLLEFAGRYGLAVQGGPHQGMQYLPKLLCLENVDKYALFPKILGSYERELHAVLAGMLRKGYDRVVNIGCADGYYSIGISRELPKAHIYAFDIDHEAQQICQQMAQLNGVADRVTVGGECGIKDLKGLVRAGTLVICDCEGCELDPPRPDLAPNLARGDLIVELHDCVNPSISSTISDRFGRTHKILVLNGQDRNPSNDQSLRRYSPYKRRLALGEWRWARPMWAIMTPKDGAMSGRTFEVKDFPFFGQHENV